MYFRSNNILLKSAIFKKRRIGSKKYSFKNYSLYLKNTILVELYLIKKLLFRLKRVYKKKKISLFINLNKNHIISKKPKNSRMGKGKGRFVRYVYKIKLFTPIIRFNTISDSRFVSTQNVLNRKNAFFAN